MDAAIWVLLGGCGQVGVAGSTQRIRCSQLRATDSRWLGWCSQVDTTTWVCPGGRRTSHPGQLNVEPTWCSTRRKNTWRHAGKLETGKQQNLKGKRWIYLSFPLAASFFFLLNKERFFCKIWKAFASMSPGDFSPGGVSWHTHVVASTWPCPPSRSKSVAPSRLHLILHIDPATPT